MKEFGKTERGFKIYGELVDDRGCEIRVQESSAVGPAKVYLFCFNTSGVYHDKDNKDDVPGYLNVAQAKQLIEALQNYVEDAESSDNWRNHPDYVETFYPLHDFCYNDER